MSLYKIFKKRTRPGAPGLVHTPQEYVFSVCWTVPGSCLLFMLVGKANGGPSTPIITHTIADTDGEISVKIGDFPIGESLEINFGVEGITDLERVAVYVTNKTSNEIVKMNPQADQFKKLPINEPWTDKVSFTTF
jgi:pyocin large subunit-like protein